MFVRTLSLTCAAALVSATTAFAQNKPYCDDVANAEPGENCIIVGAASSGGLTTAGGPLLGIVLLLGLTGGGGNGTTGTTGTTGTSGT